MQSVRWVLDTLNHLACIPTFAPHELSGLQSPDELAELWSLLVGSG